LIRLIGHRSGVISDPVEVVGNRDNRHAGLERNRFPQTNMVEPSAASTCNSLELPALREPARRFDGKCITAFIKDGRSHIAKARAASSASARCSGVEAQSPDAHPNADSSEDGQRKLFQKYPSCRLIVNK